MHSVSIENSILSISPCFKIKSLQLFDVKIESTSNSLKEYVQSELTKVLHFFKCREDIYKDEIILGLRALYKNFKIDPSRYRPSPERILRKLTVGKPFNYINNIVDISNLISVKYRIPVSLYDLDKINGDLTIKKCLADDKYLGITGMEISTKDKILIFDDTGAVGSPTTDADRTKITDSTARVVFIVYGPENVAEGYLDEMLLEYSEKITGLNIGRITEFE